MIGTLGARLRSLRNRLCWTQERLAGEAKVSSRQVQRIEGDELKPRAHTVRLLAGALGVNVSQLYTGLTSEEISALQEDYTCPHCGAHLTQRTFVDHEYGDTELEMFACGHTQGWMSRPCPKEPRFPEFEDYELVPFKEADGSWWCEAIGKTESAREVSLQTGCGQSKQEAEKWVERSYIQARYGYEAAQAFLPIGG